MADPIDPRLQYAGAQRPQQLNHQRQYPSGSALQNEPSTLQQPYYMNTSPTGSRSQSQSQQHTLPNPLPPPQHPQQVHPATALDPALDNTPSVQYSPTDDGSADHEDDYRYVLRHPSWYRTATYCILCRTSPVGTHDPSQPGAATRHSRPRACDSCRSLKVRPRHDSRSTYSILTRILQVRCAQAEGDASGPCQRCKKAKREWYVTSHPQNQFIN